MGIEIPVPARFIHHYVKALEGQGLGVNCRRLTFDLTGGIRAEDVRITGMNGMDILRVRQVYTHIQPEDAMGGIPNFDILVIDDATVLLPAYISETGEENAVARHVFAKLGLSPSAIRVEYLQGEFGKLTASTTNPFVIDLRKFRAVHGRQAPADTRMLAAKIASQLAHAGRAETYLDALEAPTTSLSFAKDFSSVSLRLLAKSATYDDVTARNIEVEMAADKSLNLNRAFARADNIEGMGAVLSGIRLDVDTPVKIPSSADALSQVTARAHAYVATASYRGETIRGVDVLARRSPNETKLDSAFLFDDLPVSLHATIGDNRMITADFELLALLDTGIRLAKIEPEKITKRFYSKVPFRILGHTTIPREFSAATLDFELWGRDMDARGMPVDHAYIKGAMGGGMLFCSDVQLQSGGSFASGTFLQDVSTLDWRMCLKGKIYPPELGPVLGHWWNPIWEDFQFAGQRATADVDISGNWHVRHYVNLVGVVDLKDVLYNGVRLDKGSLDLRTGKGYVDIYNLRATSADGSMKGELAWLIREDDTLDVVLNLDSDLPVEQLDMAFGSVLTEEIPDWTFSKTPHVIIRGNLEKLAPGHWNDEIYSEAHVENGSWQGIHFDELDLSVWNNKARTLIKIPRASILGGTMSGIIGYGHEADDKSITLNLTLVDTDITPTLHALQSLGGKKPEAAQSENGRIGKVRMHYEGAAKLRDVAGTVEGKGTFTIHDADLAKIKVFGALSSLMDSIGRGFGTFTLNMITSDFTTKKGVARLRHTSLSGPAAKVEAKGSIGLVSKALDFDAKVFLLSTDKASLMNLFGTILAPFGYIMELNLKGTFDEPSWRFKIDPRNIFDGGNPASTAKPEANGTTKPSTQAGRK